MQFKKIIPNLILRARASDFTHSYSRERQVMFHWKIILLTFLFFSFLIIGGGLLMYLNFSRGQLTAERKAGYRLPVTSEFLTKTADYYDAKKATFNQVRRSEALTPDPSR